MAGTLLRMGWTNPLTDGFGAHPTLGAVFDLNDGVTFTLVAPDGVSLPPPARMLTLTGNPRTQGERATRAIYRQNRRVTAQVILGPMGSYADLVSNIRALVAWIDAPPAVPITLFYQPINATAPVYLDVVGAACDIPADEGDWLRLQFEPIELLFVCRPGLRGDRITLQNLLSNPGFQAPSGPGVLAWSDTFATLNAYTVVSGASPTPSPANGYPDTIIAPDTPARYYRLDEASGTVAFDASPQAGNLTYHAAPTLGVAGAISGDTDTAVTFASASSQYASSVSTTGLPSANAAWTVEAWLKFAANPAGIEYIACFGATANASLAGIVLNSSGQVLASTFGVGNDGTASAALSTGVWHHVAATWDGTNLRGYLDGALFATNALSARTLGTSGVAIGASTAPGQYLSGSVDEVALYAGALSATRISAHHTAGHSGVTGTVANAMTIPSGTTLSFGSPAWAAVNQWRVRFRWQSGGIAAFFLHAPDVNDRLYAQVTGTAVALVQEIAGVYTTFATTAITLIPGEWYWLTTTQFPGLPGDPVGVQTILSYDALGAPGATLASLTDAGANIGAPTSGAPQLLANTGALVVGGLPAGGLGVGAPTHSLSLFGPGGWLFEPITNGWPATAPSAGVWEFTPGAGPNGSPGGNPNTFMGGPTASYGAARIDLPAVGTAYARWRQANSPGLPGALPIPTAGQTVGYSAWVKTTGLSATGSVQLWIDEVDATGNYLRSGGYLSTANTVGAWVHLSGSYTTGASCAYINLSLQAQDTTAGASAGARVWFDNTHVWNQTTTGQTTMPYCELRFPQSPAQLILSGLLGDLPAPSALAFGGSLATWPVASTLGFAIGRMGQAGQYLPSAQPAAQLVGPSYGWYDATRGAPVSTATLDPNSYGGYFISAPIGNGWNPRAFSPRPIDTPGTFHLLNRFQSGQTLGNLPNVGVRIETQMRSQAWYGQANQNDQIGAVTAQYVYPLTASATWQVCDSGQVALPGQSLGALTDPTQNYLTPRPQWYDSTGGGSTGEINWQLLLPVDGSLLNGVINNPSNAPFGVTNQWLWAYFDGLLTNRAGANDGPAWTYSLENGPLPNPAHGAGGPGTQTTGVINVNSGADPYLVLDPQLNGGVNLLGAYLADGVGTELPFYAEVMYSPLYLHPR